MGAGEDDETNPTTPTDRTTKDVRLRQRAQLVLLAAEKGLVTAAIGAIVRLSEESVRRRYGLGAVNYHTGETVVIFRQRKRRREVAELLQAILDKHPHETVYVAWDNSSTHEDNEVEAVIRAAAGRLVLLYLPTYSPWLNSIEMLWRHFRHDFRGCT